MSDIDGNAARVAGASGRASDEMLSSKCGMETLREADHYGWISSVRYLGAKS